MSIWFEGSGEIECNIQQVKQSVENVGEHFAGIVSHMPGLTSVELVEEGSDFVTIRTSEGLMKRTNLTKRVEDDLIVIEYDEEYEAGSMVTTKSHFLDEFTTSDSGVNHRIVLSDVEAPGLMGFLYRKFGSANIGSALLQSHKTYFEQQDL